MKLIFRGIILLSVLLLVSSDPVETETRLDMVQTFKALNITLNRVQKKARVSYVYALVPDWKWHQFPDFAFNFELQFGQSVYVMYNVQNWTPELSYFRIRVFIDNVEREQMRTATGPLTHHSNHMSHEFWLEKGTHKIEVLYSTDKARPGGQGLQDWNTAVCVVRYHVVNQNCYA